MMDQEGRQVRGSTDRAGSTFDAAGDFDPERRGSARSAVLVALCESDVALMLVHRELTVRPEGALSAPLSDGRLLPHDWRGKPRPAARSASSTERASGIQLAAVAIGRGLKAYVERVTVCVHLRMFAGLERAVVSPRAYQKS